MHEANRAIPLARVRSPMYLAGNGTGGGFSYLPIAKQWMVGFPAWKRPSLEQSLGPLDSRARSKLSRLTLTGVVARLQSA